MNQKLIHHFQDLEMETQELLNEVKSLSSGSFHQSPGDLKWSASQILTHLLTSEQLSLSYLQKKSLGINNLENTGLLEDIKIFVLKISQRIPLKYKAPRVVIEHTPAPLSYVEIVEQWGKLRLDIKAFLEKIEDENIHKKIYKHPRVGMLNVVQAIQFFREHIIHHRPQIRKIIRSLKKG